MIRCAYVFTRVYRHDTGLHVCVCVGGVGMFVGVSCACVWANGYVCICHPYDRNNILCASKDKKS